MRICMVLGQEFPPDIRVEKECRTLINSRYEVHLVTRNKGRRPVEDRSNGIHIHRLRYLPKFFRRLNAWVSVPHFMNPIWLVKLSQVVDQYNIGVLHVHDLPLMPSGIIVGRCQQIPVILDNHENFPEFLRAVGYRGVVLTGLFNARFFKHVERFCMRRAAAVVCTADEAVEYYSQMGFEAEKFIAVINAVDLDTFSSPVISPEIVERYRGEFVLSYIGGIGKHRNLELVLRATCLVVEKIENVRILVVGRSEGDTVKRLNELSDSLGISSYVTFVGEVPFQYVPTYMDLSRIGLICHTPSVHTNTTTPHKLFQYMAMAKPVIVTDVRPLKRIVESENCGIVVPWDNPRKLADAILWMYRDPERARELGRNGRRAVIEKYNWQRVSMRLVDVYRAMEDGSSEHS